jgi:hypothetical protein
MGLWLSGHPISFLSVLSVDFDFPISVFLPFPFSTLSLFYCFERFALTFRIPPSRSLEFVFLSWDSMSY